MAEGAETLLITDDATPILELGRDGKFSSQIKRFRKRTKVILKGEELVICVDRDRWFIVKRPAQGAMIGRARRRRRRLRPTKLSLLL